MRVLFRVFGGLGLVGLVMGCFSGRHDDPGGDTADDVGGSLAIYSCDINCDQDGLDLSMRAGGATEAEVEFFSSGTRVAIFALTQLDDTNWTGYPAWPSGYSFADCDNTADFVCVVRDAAGEEVREAQP